MVNLLKSGIKSLLSKLGYRLERIRSEVPGGDPFFDMKRHITVSTPIIFDVGAHVGETVEELRRFFPNSVIHAFEPSPTTFENLKQRTAPLSGVKLWNCAIGSEAGTMTLNENSHSVMTSLLPLGPIGWGDIIRTTLVPVRTVDELLEAEAIPWLDILKCDTQGFDLHVLKGAAKSLAAGSIGLVTCEINFMEMYKDGATLDEIYRFMTDRNYRLVSFYNINRHANAIMWADALFVSNVLSPVEGRA